MKRAAAVLLAGALLTGCGRYELRGKVIGGSVSAISFVEADDPQLHAPGLDAATIELTLDPRSLGRKVVASGPANPDGSFTIPVDQLGAGWLEYEFGLVVRCPGHDSAVEFFRLPSRGKRVLVTLARGLDRYRPREDPLKDTETFLRD